MRENGWYVSQITQKKSRITQGITAADQALRIILDMNTSSHLRNDAPSEPDAGSPASSYPSNISPIEGSLYEPANSLMTPGLFQLRDILNDHLITLIQSIDKGMISESPDLIDQITQVITLNTQLRCHHSLLEQSDQPGCEHESGTPDSLSALIISLKQTLESALADLHQSSEYGAFCYQLETIDKFMVRSFMQGVRGVRSEDEMDMFPVTIAAREDNRLIIGYYVNETERIFRVEIQEYDVTVQIAGSSIQRFHASLGLNSIFPIPWRVITPGSVEFDTEIPGELPCITGTFHARSSDEVMQFLSYFGFQISRNILEFSACEQIVG